MNNLKKLRKGQIKLKCEICEKEFKKKWVKESFQYK